MTRQCISYNHDSGKLAVLNCPLACVKAWTDKKVVLVSNYTQSGGGGGSWILVCRDRSGLLTMALTNILAIGSPFWKPKTKKGHYSLVTEENLHYRKEREKTANLVAENVRVVCAYGDKYGCKSRLSTTKDNEFVNWDLKNVPHNHAASIIKTEWIKLRNQIKEDTKKEKTRKPMGIINTNNKWG